jgi:hypothetical protein
MEGGEAMRGTGGIRSAAVTLAAVALMAGGCGGGSSKSSNAKSTGTTAAPTTVAPTTTTAVDTSGDAAAAARINLKATDFPAGFTSTPAEAKTTQDTADENKLLACVGLPPRDQLHSADADSEDFHKGDTEVSSSVSFARTADIAKQELAAIKSDKAVTCLTTELNEVIARGANGATVTNVSLVAQPAPTGGDGGFAYRFTAIINAQGQQAPITAEILGELVGRAELQVTTTGVGAVTVPASLQQQLLAKMEARAKP